VCVCVCVCVCGGRQGSLALAGSLSRRRKTLIQNRLTEPASLSMWRPYSPIVSDLPCRWVLSTFVGDEGRLGATSSHVKNLTAQVNPQLELQLKVWFWPPRTPRSSRCRLCVCVCVCVCVLERIVWQNFDPDNWQNIQTYVLTSCILFHGCYFTIPACLIWLSQQWTRLLIAFVLSADL